MTHSGSSQYFNDIAGNSIFLPAGTLVAGDNYEAFIYLLNQVASTSPAGVSQKEQYLNSVQVDFTAAAPAPETSTAATFGQRHGSGTHYPPKWGAGRFTETVESLWRFDGQLEARARSRRIRANTSRSSSSSGSRPEG